MGEKDNKIILKVDLECQRCYKKIRKTLCKIQDKLDIKSISYNEKANTVTIGGPFDAEKVCRKLCCHAGRVIKEMNIVGKDGGDKPAAKPAENKDAGKADKPKEAKGDKPKEGKADGGKEAKGDQKEAKADKPAEKAEAKAENKDDAKPKEKDDKQEKKVKFAEVPKADIGPLLEKMKASMAKAEPPCGEPIAPQPAAAQGVAVHSIWPAPASSLAGYSYNPSYDPSYYSYGAGAGSYGGYGGGCGCGYGGGYCRCGKAAAAPPAGGYYGVPVYDNQGWYYGGGRQPYYPPQQQSCCEDPNAGCSVM